MFPRLFSEYSAQKVKEQRAAFREVLIKQPSSICICILTCTSSFSLVILWKGRMRKEVKDRPLTRGWFSSVAMFSRNVWFPSLFGEQNTQLKYKQIRVVKETKEN